jgi:hypothetical protein
MSIFLINEALKHACHDDSWAAAQFAAPAVVPILNEALLLVV